MSLDELLESHRPPKKDEITDEDLARLFMKYRGLLKQWERDKAFSAATHENIRIASAKLDELVKERTVELKTANEQLQQEITERKQAEEALRESENRFRSLVETTSDWVWEVDENGVYTYVSPKISDILGYKPEKVLGMTPLDLMTPEEARRVSNIFGTIAASREPFECLENINLHKDGHPVVLETSGVPIFDSDKTFRGYRGIDRDITDRKQTEVELERHRVHLEELVRKRTNELQSIVNSMAGREVRMAELKGTIKRLHAQLESEGLTPAADDPLIEGRRVKREE